MKRILIICVALVSSLLLSASVASAAKPADHVTGGKSAAAKACVAQKKADKSAFEATYGKHAMRNCIKGVPASGEVPEPGEFKNAAKECKAARAADPDGFREQYGTNPNGNNAFGKCVSSKVGEDDDEADDDEADDDEDEADDDEGDDDDDQGEDEDEDEDE